jgi:hypothetical protein
MQADEARFGNISLRPATAWSIAALVIGVSLGACSPESPGEEPAAAEPAVAEPAKDGEPNPLREAYFGDLHVHTRFSSDAFIFNTRATPDDAYRYAKGEAIRHAGGFDVQLSGEPLDFLAVTDHGEYLGVFSSFTDPASALAKSAFAQRVLAATEAADIRATFQSMREMRISGQLAKELQGWEPIHRSAWQEVVAAAERHNAPGEFTTFVGYEYTSAPDSQNLHRNVIFRGRGPDLPFTAQDSTNPELLWAWMDARRAEGIEALAIPHNSNGSNGQMFRLETFDGKPLDGAYAETRMRNEPLVEVTQVKGTSDTHPMLSPNDEWANFEIMSFRIASPLTSDPPGSYARDAYGHGLELEEKGGFNPFKFGLIGSSDTHNAAGSFDESSYFSKVGRVDDTPAERGSVPLETPGPGGERYQTAQPFQQWGASGLAGVWAEENTREAIYDAMRRKETFATSGPRLRVRFFAGYELADGLASDPGAVEAAYAGGVPMGADLIARGDAAPRFLVLAMRDPRSAPLQRAQIIKGWLENGEAREQVFDVACSDSGAPDPATYRCPDNGATVDLATCTTSTGSGAAELVALWTDPSFTAGQRAFYYARVLENPTCRWSTWDAIRAGVEPNPALQPTIQERAWSSPIWYVPAP